MGQFVLRFSKRMRERHSHTEAVEPTQNQHVEFIQTQHEKRVDTLNLPEAEGLSVPTRA